MREGRSEGGRESEKEGKGRKRQRRQAKQERERIEEAGREKGN